jgi:hypothetical protein
MEYWSVPVVPVRRMKRTMVMMKKTLRKIETVEHVEPCEPILCVVTMAVRTHQGALLCPAVDWMLTTSHLVPAQDE